MQNLLACVQCDRSVAAAGFRQPKHIAVSADKERNVEEPARLAQVPDRCSEMQLIPYPCVSIPWTFGSYHLQVGDIGRA